MIDVDRLLLEADALISSVAPNPQPRSRVPQLIAEEVHRQLNGSVIPDLISAQVQESVSGVIPPIIRSVGGVSVSDIRPLVEAEVRKLPKPKDGKDGKDGKNGRPGEIRSFHRSLEEDSSEINFNADVSGARLINVRDAIRGGWVNVLWFNGVDPSGRTDSAVGVQKAIDYVVSLGGGTVYFPAGVYLLSATVSWTTAPVILIGAGMNAVELRAAHSSGAVIRVGYLGSAVSRMKVGASAARTAGAAGTNVGILDMPPDTAGAGTDECFYEQVYITSQPSHGLVFAANYKDTIVRNCRFGDIGGHGVYLEDGSTYGLVTNTERIGGVRIEHSRMFRCTGHGIAAGKAGTSQAYRIAVDNVDAFHCALAAGVRNSAHCHWFYCENLEVKNCGIGGFSGTAPRVLAVGGIYANGRNAQIINNRYIDILGNAVTLGPESDGAAVEHLHVTGDVIVALSPAVVVESGCTGVTVRTGNNSNITKLMTESPANTGNRSEVQGLTPQGFRSARQETTIADDAVATILLKGITRGTMVLNGNSSNARSPIIAFRAGDANAYCSLQSNDANVVVSTGALTGTTGADTNLNISVSTSLDGDGNATIYIENRRGASLAYMPTFLSLANGELVL